MVRLLQKDEWVIYAAFLPTLLTLVAIGSTAATAWRAQTPWHVPAVSAVCAEPDGYVEGLAKRGIVKLPGYEDAPADELGTPAAVAAAELRARTCVDQVAASRASGNYLRRGPVRGGRAGPFACPARPGGVSAADPFTQ